MSRRTPLERFMEKVAAPDPETGCWNWTGAKSNGYGHVRINYRLYTAHRAGYTMLRGPIPDGLELDHLCRNRACVNPDHLEPVTHRVNSLRSTSPVALHAVATHCLRGHAFDEGNTKVHVRPDGGSERRCRACLSRRVACPDCGLDISYASLPRHRRHSHVEVAS